MMLKGLEFCTYFKSKYFCLAVPASVLKNVAASLDAGLDEARQVRQYVKQLLLEDESKFPLNELVTYSRLWVVTHFFQDFWMGEKASVTENNIAW